MSDTAAHLVDRVLPDVPVRQWVLTLPYPLRYRCAWDARLTTEVLRAFLRALFADLRRRAKHHHGVRRGLCGAVTAIQRFGSALNTNPHFHSLVLDGVYVGPAHQPGRFLPLPPPETEDVARVMAGTARRLIRLLERRGLEGDDDPLAEDDPLLATLTAASIRSRVATGPEAGQPWRRLGDRVEPAEIRQEDADSPPRCVREGGMSLHADVAVPANDRRRLERLARYVLRPPLALDRLEALPDGRLSYRLKTRWRDGTTHILMERHELLERLAPLIPPPRAHQIRYHGLLAPCASGRDRVVPAAAAGGAGSARSLSEASPPRPHSMDKIRDPRAPEPARVGADGGQAGPSSPRLASRGPSSEHASKAPAHPLAVPSATRAARPKVRDRRLTWADLLRRVFGVDALRCSCGASMRVLAAIADPAMARRILVCLSLPERAPPIVTAPSCALGGVAGPLDCPEIDFDQTPPEDWGTEE